MSLIGGITNSITHRECCGKLSDSITICRTVNPIDRVYCSTIGCRKQRGKGDYALIGVNTRATEFYSVNEIRYFERPGHGTYYIEPGFYY